MPLTLRNNEENYIFCVQDFLSRALSEMGRETSHAVTSDVCQVWLDQCWRRYAQMLQLPGFSLRIATADFGL